MLAERSALLLLALVLEAAFSYPGVLYRYIKHPVVWVGTLIDALDRQWNAGSSFARRFAGCALVLVLIVLAGGAGWLLEHGVRVVFERTGLADAARTIGTGVVIALIATSGLAQRSLYDHVLAVLQPLQAGDLGTARKAVAHIVGRDTEALGSEGVSAAAIESLAESFCDGVVAPAFWFLVAGLPGLFIFKAISTADSLIGHRDERHGAFGWAAARADDLMNLLPARVAGLMLCVAGRGGLATMFRDARKHDSPNAGWPEAAMAGALARQLGGPASYAGEWVARPTFGDGVRPDAASLRNALHIYRLACGLLWFIVGSVACLP
jgi:adenosylcobinamide-phosphate synthase